MNSALQRLAVLYPNIVAAQNDPTERSRLARSSVEPLERIADAHPIVSGEGLELAASIIRSGSAKIVGSVTITRNEVQKASVEDSEALPLYQRSVELRRPTDAARSPEVASAALCMADIARRVGDESTFRAGAEIAVASDFPIAVRMGKKALSLLAAAKGDYQRALEIADLVGRLEPRDISLKARLLFGVGRYADAADLWSTLPADSSGTPKGLLCAAWACYRDGSPDRAKTLLSQTRTYSDFYLGTDVPVRDYLERILSDSGNEPKLPNNYDEQWGPVRPPENESLELSWLFGRGLPVPAAALATEFERLAHGSTPELARRLRVECRQRKQRPYDWEKTHLQSKLEEAFAIFEREGDHEAAFATLREMHLAESLGKPRVEHAKRALLFASEHLKLVKSWPAITGLAAMVVDHDMRVDPDAAADLGRTWVGRAMAAGYMCPHLHYATSQAERATGRLDLAAQSLRRAIESAAPEDRLYEQNMFHRRRELVTLLGELGEVDVELQSQLDATRAKLASEWRSALRKNAKAHKVVELIAPFLEPGLHGADFVEVPFSIMKEASTRLGSRYANKRVNARPSLKSLLGITAPHAALTTFSGFVAHLCVTTLRTADLPDVRAALASADDIGTEPDGRLYVWWD